MLVEVGARWREIKGRKIWDNCNSIINNVYLKKNNIQLSKF